MTEDNKAALKASAWALVAKHGVRSAVAFLRELINEIESHGWKS